MQASCIEPFSNIARNFMTHFKQFATVVAFAAVAGAAQAAGIPANISFDGSCDGLINLHKVDTTGAAGTWTFAQCPGSGDPFVSLGGVQGKALGAATKGYIMGSSGASVLVGQEITIVVNNNHTWTLYKTLDGTIANSGTWSAGAPHQTQGLTPSTSAK
jgi:hypothetical protein